MEHQRPRSWPARLGIAAFCGVLVAAVSLVGYEPNPRDAGASQQPAPTSIAFVPMHPEPVAQPQALQAGRMLAVPESAELHGSSARMIAPAGEPEPATSSLPDAEACSFPCFNPEAEETPTATPDPTPTPKPEVTPDAAADSGS